MSEQTQVTPEGIMQLGLGFWGSKTLLSAVELGLFTELAERPAGRGGAARASRPPSAERAPTSSTRWWRSACSSGRRRATPTRPRPTCSSTVPSPPTSAASSRWPNARLYPFWGSDGGPADRAAAERGQEGGDFFAELYADPARLAQFARAMSGISVGAGQAIASKFPWGDRWSVIDIGCAEGAVPVQVALAHAHITGGGFDLPPLEPIFDDYVAALRALRPPRVHRRGFLQRPAAAGRRARDGPHPPRLGPGREARLLHKAHDALPDGGR